MIAGQMIVVGLDLSLTGSGLAVVSWAETDPRLELLRSRPGARVPTPAHKGRKPDKGIYPLTDRADRLWTLAARIIAVLDEYPLIDLAVVESPSFRSIGGFPHERSGLFWLVMTHLHHRGVTIAEIAPRARAQYATGSGAADKVSVVRATVPRYELSSRNDNVVDAFILAAMGCRNLGHPLENTLPERHLAAMRNVNWPKRERQ